MTSICRKRKQSHKERAWGKMRWNAKEERQCSGKIYPATSDSDSGREERRALKSAQVMHAAINFFHLIAKPMPARFDGVSLLPQHLLWKRTTMFPQWMWLSNGPGPWWFPKMSEEYPTNALGSPQAFAIPSRAHLLADPLHFLISHAKLSDLGSLQLSNHLQERQKI